MCAYFFVSGGKVLVLWGVCVCACFFRGRAVCAFFCGGGKVCVRVFWVMERWVSVLSVGVKD